MPKQKRRALVPQSFYDPIKDPVVFHDQASKALDQMITLLDAPDVTLDEAHGINAQAAKIAAIAKLIAPELVVKAAEATVRAAQKVGMISVELPTMQGARQPLPTVGKKSKADVLEEAGVTTSTAQRYEKLAGGRDPARRHAVKAVAEEYFADCRESQKAASIEGLQSEIDMAVPATPPRKLRTAEERREIGRSTVVPNEPSTISLTTRIERETYSLPSTERLEPQEVRLVPYYSEPRTYAEGIERAAAMLDDMAKERPRPSLEVAAERVRKLCQN
jgi:hypothetical protein